MTATAETEQQAILADARHRLAELQAVRDVLLPDPADPAVRAELSQIDGEIKAAVAAPAHEPKFSSIDETPSSRPGQDGREIEGSSVAGE